MSILFRIDHAEPFSHVSAQAVGNFCYFTLVRSEMGTAASVVPVGCDGCILGCNGAWNLTFHPGCHFICESIGSLKQNAPS
jgi:hypothetical protein